MTQLFQIEVMAWEEEWEFSQLIQLLIDARHCEQEYSYGAPPNRVHELIFKAGGQMISAYQLVHTKLGDVIRKRENKKKSR